MPLSHVTSVNNYKMFVKYASRGKEALVEAGISILQPPIQGKTLISALCNNYRDRIITYSSFVYSFNAGSEATNFEDNVYKTTQTETAKGNYLACCTLNF
jgi:hypothetical protein